MRALSTLHRARLSRHARASVTRSPVVFTGPRMAEGVGSINRAGISWRTISGRHWGCGFGVSHEQAGNRIRQDSVKKILGMLVALG